ncbi:MAG TPA: hypothetical protein VEV17_14000 [Bryobacteraceae bacterium]|nr:hypothetical protein [Bryobacteraceae bacterium]
MDPETDLRDVPEFAQEPVLPEGSEQTYREILRMTRLFIQYGITGFAVLFIVVGAVESLFGR